MLKRWTLGLFFALALLYNGKEALAAETLETSARAACVMELGTGRVLYAYNERERLPMASTTKIMTALLALESGDMDAPVTCSKNAYGVPGTSIYLSLGETLSMGDMVTGLMLASGNDAAVAIAEHLGGSVEGFAQRMNARAQEIGATDTHFVTPHGLPMEGHYTSAYDLALIAREAMQRLDFRELVSTQRATIPWADHDYDRVLHNKNKLLSTYEGATGIKTGYTRAAGRCLAFGARREGMELVGVVLNCGDWFDESARLLDRCFADYTLAPLCEANTSLGTVQVSDGVRAEVEAVVRRRLSAPLLPGETACLEIDVPSELPAPVWMGQQLGEVRVVVDGQVIDTEPLIAGKGVRRANFLTRLMEIMDLWTLKK